MDSHATNDSIIRNNIQQFTNVADLDVWDTANGLEADELVNLRRLELMCKVIDRPQAAPQTSATESKECTNSFQEVQNQSELTQSQKSTLTAELQQQINLKTAEESKNELARSVLNNCVGRKIYSDT